MAPSRMTNDAAPVYHSGDSLELYLDPDQGWQHAVARASRYLGRRRGWPIFSVPKSIWHAELYAAGQLRLSRSLEERSKTPWRPRL